MRLTIALFPLLFCAPALAQFPAAQPGTAGPKAASHAALTLDYIAAEQALWGVTLAPTHYDPAYPAWGYYAGFAWGPSERLDLPEPEQGKVSQYLGRFGLSYGLTQSIYLYGGATYHMTETRYTNGITPLCTDCGPVWTEDKDYTWGAELGLRLNLGQHLVIGAGYNWATESAVISLGLR
ncbi:porin family protein [Ferrimonas balearica]|uniref:porin family protein n=1 Tax=Ferrimonas balearica TaxID=44012 RepID=UPI001C9A0C02|nr:porin family protein [Ferrimonas balearica]MBY5921705.1 porin family protein [Ferrimonas balearica]MBY5994955.1 porin family protein [Ferrimonas balearica]